MNCPHCGSTNTPKYKSEMTSKDYFLTFLLLIVFFPAGIIYFIYRKSKSKVLVCPDCHIPYEIPKQTSLPTDSKTVLNTAINVAKNPEIRKSVKDLVSSLEDFQDTFYMN